MDEVDPDAVEIGAEVTERVEPAFLLAPVEAVNPVGEQLAQVAELRALLPSADRRLAGLARGADALLQVGQDVLADVDRERLDHTGAPSRSSRVRLRATPPP